MGRNGDFRAVTAENALRIDRPTLGDVSPIVLYRLVRLVAMEELFGVGAGAAAYIAGKRMGQELGFTKIEDFLKFCVDMKIGIIEIPEQTPSKIHVDVYECVTCSGLSPVGHPVCSFEGGLIAGVVESIMGVHVTAKEVTCIGGLGDETCGFDLALNHGKVTGGTRR